MQFIVQGYPAYAYTGGRPFEPKQPAVVFVHGAAFDHSVWQWQSRYFAHHGLSVLAVDLPGHGRSPGPVRTSIGGLADWVGDFIDAAMLEQAALVGHSMGALIALETAIRRASRVAKLAMVGISVPMPVGDAFIAAARDDSPAGFDMEAVWGLSRGALLAQSPIPGASLLGAGRALNGRAHPGVLAADLEACNSYAPSMESIRALEMPALIVGGKRDQMTPPKAVRAFASAMPQAKLVELDAGHSMMSEAPRELLRALRAFLAAGEVVD